MPDLQTQRALDLVLSALQFLCGSGPNPQHTGLPPPPCPQGPRNRQNPQPTMEGLHKACPNLGLVGGLPLEWVLEHSRASRLTLLLFCIWALGGHRLLAVNHCAALSPKDTLYRAPRTARSPERARPPTVV